MALVEGSVSTPEQENEIRDIRRRSRFLITLGACASHGGIQGLRNFGSLNVDKALAIVYASPQYIETLACSRPASAYVAVDLELPGCPINKHQLLGVLGQMLAGARPKVPNHCALPGVQAPAPGVHFGGPRVAVHGAGDVHGVRCALPQLRSPLLQLLWPQRPAQHGGTRPTSLQQLGLEPDDIRRLFQTFYANAHEFNAGRATSCRDQPQPPDQTGGTGASGTCQHADNSRRGYGTCGRGGSSDHSPARWAGG